MIKYCIICVSILFAGCSSYYTMRTVKEIYQKISLDTIDIKQVKDGTYTGFCGDMLLVNALVRVTVSNGSIKTLDLLEHRYNRTYDGSAVVKEILAKQTLDVDGVAGATYSWKSIVKATERALKSGL